ncbi:hypothetical protein [Compostibacter hankyongensis]|uniref:Lipoprotein n=1 Tax=Compostibacter hankyongensis TaxID=1007089 RepID=A0ABP8FXQ9_9BACT
MKYLILLVLSGMVFSCTTDGRKDADDISGYGVSDTMYVDAKGNRYKHLAQIPDSLYTPEQKELVRRLDEIIVKYTKAKDKHMVLELTKEQYLKMGLPERYYIILKKNIQDNNAFLDSAGITNVEELIRKRNENIYKKLEDHKNQNGDK